MKNSGMDGWNGYGIEEAFKVANEITEWPCGIWACSENCGKRYGEMIDLAYDLAGYEESIKV